MTVNQLGINFPVPAAPMVDPQTGKPTPEWWYAQQALVARTGGPEGISVGSVQETADEALANAATAQTTANTAVANAATAQTTANEASAAVAAETARAETAEALLAPKASPTFTGVATSPEYAIGTALGPTWTTGSGVPSATQPKGSIYSRTGGGVGSTFYVSQGSGTWNAVGGV